MDHGMGNVLLRGNKRRRDFVVLDGGSTKVLEIIKEANFSLFFYLAVGQR